MPMNLADYPANWKEISLRIRQQANWTCEACCRPCRLPNERWLDFRRRLPDIWCKQVARQQFTLTVAHLDHNPANCDRANLRALCAPCHLRYDAVHHAQSRKRDRREKLEAAGQLSLPI